MIWPDTKAAADALGITVRSVQRRIQAGTLHRVREGISDLPSTELAPSSPAPAAPVDAVCPQDERFFSTVDTDAGVVLAYVPSKRKPIRVSLETDIMIHRAYSNFGEGMTMRELAQRLEWDILDVRYYLKARGLTHASDLWPEHEMESSDDEALLETDRAARAARIRRAADREEVQELKRLAAVGRNAEKFVAEALAAGMPNQIGVHYFADPLPGGDALTWIVPETDAHVNAASFRDEVEALNAARLRLIAKIRNIGPVKRFVRWVGSDWSNTDNKQGTTTKGTPQFNGADPSDVRYFYEAAYTACDTYRANADLGLDLCIVPGNHDWYTTFGLAEALKQRYFPADEADDSVRFFDGPGGRVYHRIGPALFVFAHGHVNRLSPGELRELAWTEAPEKCAGATQFHVITGDKHHRALTEGTAGDTRKATASSPQSAWSSEQGYPSRPKLHAFGVDSNGDIAYDITERV